MWSNIIPLVNCTYRCSHCMPFYFCLSHSFYRVSFICSHRKIRISVVYAHTTILRFVFLNVVCIWFFFHLSSFLPLLKFEHWFCFIHWNGRDRSSVRNLHCIGITSVVTIPWFYCFVDFSAYFLFLHRRNFFLIPVFFKFDKHLLIL